MFRNTLTFYLLTKAISRKIVSLKDVEARPKKVTLIRTQKFLLYKLHLHGTS